MEALLRSQIVSWGGELGEIPDFNICGSFFKELFENIDAETATDMQESRWIANQKLTKTEPTLNRLRKGSIIQEFQRKQIAKNTVKGTESAVHRLQAWYNDRYGQTQELTNINKTNASDLLKHFFSKNTEGNVWTGKVLYSCLQQYGQKSIHKRDERPAPAAVLYSFQLFHLELLPDQP